MFGGGPVDLELAREVLALSPDIFAADGGARHALHLGHPVQAIIGDLDSLTNLEVWRESGTNIVHVTEQDSTDFEKCLAEIVQNPVIGLGFLGGRVDHELAALSALLANAKRPILLLGDEDAVIHCPARFAVDLPAGTRLSLFPLGKVTGEQSSGLRWPINGLRFEPGGQIGTSNEVTGPVDLTLSGPGLLLMAPREAWKALYAALLRSVPATEEKGPSQ